MGNGIAHVFAQNGFTVSLVDVSKDALDKAMSTVAKNLERPLSTIVYKIMEFLFFLASSRIFIT